MKTCICTVIKNEHQYLDEWIQYHLRLGIDYIFIFEDFDSNSHKDITDKYSCVLLLNISKLFNAEEKTYLLELKQTKAKSPHHFYVKRCLQYLSNNYLEFDWCFVIDADEFITLENNSSKLYDIVSLYKDYDAIVLQWKCYGACNYIQKPNQKVLEAYGHESTGYLVEQPYALSKTCFNLKKYNDSVFWNPHQPSDKCNWCRTDFSKNRSAKVYDKIYLKHYITKSWEEYVWRLKKRGFMWGKRRNFDFFFNLNPELKCVKSELMEALKDETLVILPYKQSSAQGTELELTLSLWRKNCTFKYHFVVIGEYDKSFEEKFPWVEFIECQTKPKIDGQYNPHLDILNKFVTVINKYKEQYTGFVAMCDDEYAIKPFTLFDILQTHYHSQSFTGNSKAPKSYWNYDKWKTRQLFDKEGMSHINYTTHFPYWYEIDKLLAIIEKFNLMNESYVLEDIYFNYYEHENPIRDNEIRLGIWNYDIYQRDFQRALEKTNIKFMCNSVEGWSKDLENDLRKLI